MTNIAANLRGFKMGRGLCEICKASLFVDHYITGNRVFDENGYKGAKIACRMCKEHWSLIERQLCKIYLTEDEMRIRYARCMPKEPTVLDPCRRLALKPFVED
jgi:hypothetical protein